VAYAVREFGTCDHGSGYPILPESKITRSIASGGSLQLQAETIYVIITADANGFMTADGATPTSQDIPVPAAAFFSSRRAARQPSP
jgi:hypothetical protein